MIFELKFALPVGPHARKAVMGFITDLYMRHVDVLYTSFDRFAHELAEAYGLSSVSYDPEPKRYVSIIKAPKVKGEPPIPPHSLLSTAAKVHHSNINHT